MIIHNKKNIISKSHNNKVISATYYGLQLVWQSVRSCFDAGYWRGDKPWDGSDAWKG